ncbi:MAG TPA: COX15/CtaA family protein [Lacipirellulaceae bacterium]|nr:COX15/CtaA family protein [Lacipirellulaceae bacterium]
MSSPHQFVRSPWPHRWAVVLACATFPLLWVGGLVTTTKAGMAVPDWPNTYGYNLFLYPWQTWLAGPWDLFVEHGHRLLAASVGMITIGLLVVLVRLERRLWVCGLGFAALALVVFQGFLGGMRVLFDERTLAMLHGMTGPLFFASTVTLAVVTSRRWAAGANANASDVVRRAENERPNASRLSGAAGHIRLLATVTAVLVYLQIVLGAVLRHVPVNSDPAAFLMAVKFHLFLAAVLTLHIGVLVWSVLSRVRSIRPLGRLALALGTLISLQLMLGASTWIVKYSIPTWARSWFSGPSVAIRDGGWLQTNIITAHVAIGSLLLGVSVALALYSHRLLTRPSAAEQFSAARLEAAV